MGMIPGFLFDSLPWWLAAPVLEIGLLVFGMALDETYVNRATVLTGALALYVHQIVAGGVWLPVGFYLDVGIAIGIYGLYAYVTDAYVPDWFRVAAYFCYSPLSIFLVIVFPDVVFVVALVIAGYANLQLMAELDPTAPYYFGPESPDAAIAAEATETGAVTTGSGADRTNSPDSVGDFGDGPGREDVSTSEPSSRGREPTPSTPESDPTTTDGGDSTERGILPEFMRRL